MSKAIHKKFLSCHTSRRVRDFSAEKSLKSSAVACGASSMNATSTKFFMNGFTLVETLVAISILSISIMGTYIAVQHSLQASTIAKDQITAFYLAEEAIEFIKNIRDENTLHYIKNKSTDWLNGITHNPTDPCYFGKTCTIDSPTKILTTCSGGFGTCPNFNQNAISSLYGYSTGPNWVATNFKREIQLQKNSNDEVLTTILISWTNRGSPHSFQITEVLFNHICP